MRQLLGWLVGAVVVLAVAGVALAGNEREDLKRQIDSLRAAVQDFDRLDEKRAVTDEITLLKTWLDEAWTQYSSEKWKKVREVVDRCIAQGELIRQKITASKLTTQAKEREAAVKQIKENIDRVKRALEEARVQKRALEMNAK